MQCIRAALAKPASASILVGSALRKPQCGVGFASAASRPVKFALLDVDGNLHDGKRPTPGAVEALARLRGAVDGLRFVTNQSQEGSGSLFAQLQAMGFSGHQHELFSALSAALKVVEQEQLRPLLLLTQNAIDEFQRVPTSNPNAVVLGTAPEHLHYDRLNDALRVLLGSESSRLIAVNKGRYFKNKDGEFVLMAGSFVSCLEFATGKQATVVGKPSQAFFHTALGDMAGTVSSEVLEQTVMIGDDAKDDVQGAMDAGMRAILVRTGKYRPGDENSFRTPPLGVVNNFSEAVDLLFREGLVTRTAA